MGGVGGDRDVLGWKKGVSSYFHHFYHDGRLDLQLP